MLVRKSGKDVRDKRWPERKEVGKLKKIVGRIKERFGRRRAEEKNEINGSATVTATEELGSATEELGSDVKVIWRNREKEGGETKVEFNTTLDKTTADE